jgi:ribosomal protein S18 acetylase RimI-like enzyme
MVRGREILGYGMLRGWDEGYTVPSLGIAIRPSAREQGLGELMVRFLHAAAIQRGVNRVRLKIYPNNTKALKLYKKLGYTFQGEEAGQMVGYIDL